MESTSESPNFGQAARIVSEYRQVLDSMAPLLALGAPETLLPVTKDEIRQAIRALARPHDARSVDPQTLDALRTAYLSLASFLPYEEANAAACLHAAFERGDRAFISSPAAEHVMARARHIEQEANALAREFDDHLKDQESDGLLSEVEALLSEFERKFSIVPGG